MEEVKYTLDIYLICNTLIPFLFLLPFASDVSILQLACKFVILIPRFYLLFIQHNFNDLLLVKSCLDIKK